MAARLTPQRHSAQAFWVDDDGIGRVGAIYQDPTTAEWLLTADARFNDGRPLPAPFERWAYEFASLPELCAFLRAPLPDAQVLRAAA